MAGRVFGIAAVGAESIMSMAKFVIPVIQTGRVIAPQAILAPHAAFMRLHGHTVADL